MLALYKIGLKMRISSSSDEFTRRFIPPEFIDEQARSILKKGAVFSLHSTDIRNPKIKRLVIISECDANGIVGKVYINTNRQAPNSQLRLLNEGRAYLDHDSYVDCSRIYPDEFEGVLEKIKADLRCHIGNVSKDDMDLIIAELISARTISKKEKQKYGII